MNIAESISTCFRKYANFSGRAQRSEFWWFAAFFFICLPLSILIFIWPLIFALLIPTLAVSVRRLHDTNRSAWWVLPPFLVVIPAPLIVFSAWLVSVMDQDEEFRSVAFLIAVLFFVIALGCCILILVLCASAGTVGSNRYGPDPLRPEAGEGDAGESPYYSELSHPVSEPEPLRRRFCSRCGIQVLQDAKFCSGCGTPV